jgi:hypothetical protein
MRVVKDTAARADTDTAIGDTDNIFPRIVVVVVIVNPVILYVPKATVCDDNEVRLHTV